MGDSIIYHEIHECFLPRKFPAIWYYIHASIFSTLDVTNFLSLSPLYYIIAYTQANM